MRFALLGDHPDGIDMARALVNSGRHQLDVYCGPPAARLLLERHGLQPRAVGELEAALADSGVDAVIVASPPSTRPAQLRRALQSELHVLCIHPADASPDTAYEAALIQGDTGRVLLPLLPLPLHPGFERLAQLARAERVRLIELQIWSTEEVVHDVGRADGKSGLPGWDVLRFLGGEIGEIYAQTPGTEIQEADALVVTGRYLNGTLLHAVYLPRQARSLWRLALVAETGPITLEFAPGWPGPAELRCVDDAGESQVESWPALDPWPMLVDRFEQAAAQSAIRRPQPGHTASESLTRTPPTLGWEDELRALELDDATRRSAERGRSSILDHQEATEEASFKGTMTLVGCSLIWLAVALLIASTWLPWLLWLIVPLFFGFLLLQGLRWVVPRGETK